MSYLELFFSPSCAPIVIGASEGNAHGEITNFKHQIQGLMHIKKRQAQARRHEQPRPLLLKRGYRWRLRLRSNKPILPSHSFLPNVCIELFVYPFEVGF